VNEILRTLGPDFGLIRARSLSQHLAAAHRLARATEIISGHQMMSDHLLLGGGPALPLMALDPMISQVVAPLWKAGKYRQAVAQGCFQAIRNPAHHLTGDWNPVTAAEQLATLSLVAR
jgi:hypothetical protein